jgi:hypothetical protein
MTREPSPRARDLLLVACLWTTAALVRLLKYMLPLPRLVALAASPLVMRPSRARVEQLRRLAHAAPEGPRLPANCLERSLGLFHLFIAAGAAPQLAVGVKRGMTRLIDGHVWVMLDGTPIAETAESLAKYERLLDFDAHGRAVAPAATPGVSAVR